MRFWVLADLRGLQQKLQDPKILGSDERRNRGMEADPILLPSFSGCRPRLLG